jgi:hypothetical protein
LDLTTYKPSDSEVWNSLELPSHTISRARFLAIVRIRL